MNEVSHKSDRSDEIFQRILERFDRLEKKLDEGFNASRIRDEELLRLKRSIFEADEGLRDSMVRRFDETDRKNDEQISLLKDVTRHLGSHK